MRLNIGSHSKKLKGFTNVDILSVEGVDIVADITKRWDFVEADSVEEIVMIEVLEHISFHQTNKVLSDCYRVLKPGGKLHIQVPDIGEMMKAWYNGQVSEAIPHKGSEEEIYKIQQETGMQVHPNRWLYAFCGAQKYGVPDIHKNIFTAEILEDNLLQTGFNKIDFSEDKLKWKLKVNCFK